MNNESNGKRDPIPATAAHFPAMSPHGMSPFSDVPLGENNYRRVPAYKGSDVHGVTYSRCAFKGEHDRRRLL